MRGGLSAEGSGELFHRHFAIGGHNDADRFAVDFRHKGLQHLLGGHVQSFGRL
jgi:hypothetical protein